jgi:hypothetical protein
MPNPDNETSFRKKPTVPTRISETLPVSSKTIEESFPDTSPKVTIIKAGDPIGYVKTGHRKLNQKQPILGQESVVLLAEVPLEPREKKPKPVPMFTKIPSELEDTYIKILLKLGLRAPDAQRNRSKLRTIVAEIESLKGNPNHLTELFSRAISLIHLSNEPNRKVPLTSKQNTVMLKDPVGHIALDIMHFGKYYGIPIPPMKYSVVERLTRLRDEYNATTLPSRRPLVSPGKTQE